MADLRSLFTLPGVPRGAVSRVAGGAARCPLPVFLRPRLWPWLCRRFGIDAASVPQPWDRYRSFLDVFARALPVGARPLPEGDAWLSPADGALIEHTRLTSEGTWLIKGTPYTTDGLLPGADVRRLAGHQALQIYLAPKDYHRYHAPADLEVLEAYTEPGDLQPVDPKLVRRSMRVLQTNRRVLLHCRTQAGEWLGLLYVGAMNVGRMLFNFDPSLSERPFLRSHRRYDPAPRFAAGEEMGRFELGSTIILVAPPGRRCLVPLGSACRAREPLLGEEQTTEN